MEGGGKGVLDFRCGIMRAHFLLYYFSFTYRSLTMSGWGLIRYGVMQYHRVTEPTKKKMSSLDTTTMFILYLWQNKVWIGN